jgi:hypothetical protein
MFHGTFPRLFPTVRRFEYWFKLIGYFVWLSFRWFNFEKVVEALVAENVYHMNLEQLQTYAKEVCFIEDEDQFHTMLNFYHDLGMIVKHRSTVILKAQWLIDLFKKLITIPPFDKVVRKRNAWHLKSYLLYKTPSVFPKPLVIWTYVYFLPLRTALKWCLFLCVKAKELQRELLK